MTADQPDVLANASDAVAERVKDLRKRQGWSTTKAFASRCAEVGAPYLTAPVLMNIESGRRKDGRRTRMITVDELLALAKALGVSPLALLPNDLAGEYRRLLRRMFDTLKPFVDFLEATQGALSKTFEELEHLAATPLPDEVKEAVERLRVYVSHELAVHQLNRSSWARLASATSQLTDIQSALDEIPEPTLTLAQQLQQAEDEEFRQRVNLSVAARQSAEAIERTDQLRKQLHGNGDNT